MRRPAIVAAGKRLAELAAPLDQPGTPEYERAARAAGAAVNAVLGGLHFNAGLAPVFGAAAGRATVFSRLRPMLAQRMLK